MITANDGIEALEVIDAHNTDISVVLLDMLMPRLNGQLLAAIRELARTTG